MTGNRFSVAAGRVIYESDELTIVYLTEMRMARNTDAEPVLQSRKFITATYFQRVQSYPQNCAATATDGHDEDRNQRAESATLHSAGLTVEWRAMDIEYDSSWNDG